jgi:feruloyl esterase
VKRFHLPAATMRRAALALAGTALATSAAYAGTASPCTALNSSFPNGAALTLSEAIGYTGQTGDPIVLGVQAQEVPANALAAGEPSPPVCSVGMVISSNGNPSQSQVTVAVLLPEGTAGTNSATSWNGRFLGTGNGGFAGSVATSTLGLGLIPSYVASGKTYVVANTDMGTGNLFHCNSTFCGSTESVALYPNQVPGGLYGDDAAITDFGYGATHLMTVVSKALISNFYGSAATYSYFHGCSTGGQQALMELQRFPNDYDGILAGSPAYDRTHLHIASAAFYEATHSSADAYLTNEALGLAHAGVLASCAGHDGGLSTDNYLNRPAQCGFDATVLQCTGAGGEVPCTDPSGTSCSCLTPHQAISMNAAWTGALDSLGRTLYPGYERGVEDPNAGVLAEEENVTEPLFDSLDYWGFGPNFDWTTLFTDTSTPQGELFHKIVLLDHVAVGADTFAGVLNANSADLSTFAGPAHQGKLLMYAGYEDPLIPSASTIDYYNAAHKRDPNVANYAKLYLAPGMWHCNGGPGANAFGNLSGQLPPIPTAFSDDVLGALVAWREAGIVPASITATKYTNDDGVHIAFQRPLCPYPNYARYTHKKQSPLLATSWTCEPGPYVTNQKFNSVYGPN